MHLAGVAGDQGRIANSPIATGLPKSRCARTSGFASSAAGWRKAPCTMMLRSLTASRAWPWETTTRVVVHVDHPRRGVDLARDLVHGTLRGQPHADVEAPASRTASWPSVRRPPPAELRRTSRP